MSDYNESRPLSQEPNVNIWQNMPTVTQDDLCQFSIYVAKRAGWTVESDEKYITIKSPTGETWEMFNGHPLPDGNEQEWASAYYHGKIPSYATDTNAALELVRGAKDFCLISFGNNFAAICEPSKLDVIYSDLARRNVPALSWTYRPNPSPALTICWAWLQAHDANRRGAV